MELRQIRYFLALSETLNFTRAAEMCNVTQPTLTLSIKKLEEELGGPLLHRDRSRTHLTHLGQMILPFLEQVFEASRAARIVAGDLNRGERIPLALGVSDALDKQRLLCPIREVRGAAQGLELRFESGSDALLAERLAAGDLDMAILDAAVVVEARMRFAPLYTEEMQILMPESDPLAARDRLSLDDLPDRHWIDLTASRVHGDFVAAISAALGGWAVQHRASRPTEAQVLVLSGLGLALAGRYEPLIEGLACRPLAAPLLTRTVGVAEMRGRPSSIAALALSRLLRAQSYEPEGRWPAA